MPLPVGRGRGRRLPQPTARFQAEQQAGFGAGSGAGSGRGSGAGSGRGGAAGQRGSGAGPKITSHLCPFCAHIVTRQLGSARSVVESSFPCSTGRVLCTYRHFPSPAGPILCTYRHESARISQFCGPVVILLLDWPCSAVESSSSCSIHPVLRSRRRFAVPWRRKTTIRPQNMLGGGRRGPNWTTAEEYTGQ